MKKLGGDSRVNWVSRFLIHVPMPKAARQALGSYRPVMEKGWRVGHNARTGAILVMTEQGVMSGSGESSMPEESRWSTEKWQWLKKVIPGAWRREKERRAVLDFIALRRGC